MKQWSAFAYPKTILYSFNKWRVNEEWSRPNCYASGYVRNCVQLEFVALYYRSL